ncbi:hypothetical protein ACLKA6_004696 [Drosophila palustris]
MELSILDLNDYCLGTVLKYHGLEDHVRFAQACNRFREVLRDWAPVLYPDFHIKRTKDTDPEDIKWEYELLCIIRDIIKRLYLDIHQVDGDASLSIDDLCTQIKAMESLEYIAINEGSILGKLSFSANSPRQQLIEKALDALEFLPNIKSVSVSSKTDIFSSCCLKRINCLEKLSIDNKIASEDLVEICKSNANLRVLWQKPLELYSTGVMHLCNEGEKLIDDAYCTLVNQSKHFRALPWRLPN